MSEKCWFLEGMLQPGKTVLIRLETFPFNIGRDPECQLSLASKDISRQHAMLEKRGEFLWLKDLNSTNGTFLNRRRLNVAAPEAPVKEGDIIHFGTLEFRLTWRTSEEKEASEVIFDTTMLQVKDELPQQFVKNDKQFINLLEKGNIGIIFEPIVHLQNQNILAHEAIAKANDRDLPSEETALFSLAKLLGKENEFSELVREKALERYKNIPNKGQFLFLNIFPNEQDLKFLLRSIQRLSKQAQQISLGMQISSANIKEIGTVSELRSAFEALNISLIIDEVSSSLSRAEELKAINPRFYKISASAISEATQDGNAAKRLKNVLKTLNDKNNAIIAKGVHDGQILQFCQRQLGIEYGQGQHFGLGR
jgi:EAL domain-containing protein (putative c-di-GMP-specific phosphodiesterase class I)